MSNLDIMLLKFCFKWANSSIFHISGSREIYAALCFHQHNWLTHFWDQCWALLRVAAADPKEENLFFGSFIFKHLKILRTWPYDIKVWQWSGNNLMSPDSYSHSYSKAGSKQYSKNMQLLEQADHHYIFLHHHSFHPEVFTNYGCDLVTIYAHK